MKQEIRDLKAGTYWADDGSCVLRVSKTDDGVLIEMADKDADIFYAFTVADGATKKFEVGEVNK